MKVNDEVAIHIYETGEIVVEDVTGGIKSRKQVSADAFIECVKASIAKEMVASGVLPEGTISFSSGNNGYKYVCIEFPERYCDIVYEKTEYKHFPIPRLVFGFVINGETILSVKLGVAEPGKITPKTKMYIYPFSNVSGFNLCCGTNRFPKIKSLHQLTGIMYFIMSMPNNNDHYRNERTRLGLEYRELLETLKDKTPEYYYSDVLIQSGKTISNFIQS